MSGPYDSGNPEQTQQTQQSAWGGAPGHQTGGQPYVEAGGGSTPDVSTGGYEQYGAYGGGGQQQQEWGYGEQSGGTGAGWGYAPGYAPPPGQRSTSRPLPGSPVQAPQDAQAQGWTGGYAGGYYGSPSGPPSQSLQPFQPPQSPQPPYGSYGSYGPASGNWGAYDGGAYGAGYGQYNSYGPPSQYGGGYGQYGAPSQYGGGYGGYGQYGPASQYGGYGQYGAPSQWGQPPLIEAAARQPWSMRRKLALIGGAVALLLVLVGGGLGYMQYNAPTAAANQICTDFRSQHYVDMYGLFDTQLQSGMTSVQFAQAVLDIDRAEGQTTKCEASIHANGFTDSSATATFVLTRPNADGLQGTAHLSKQGGAWKVTTLDQSLFGVDLHALNSVDNYCTALQSQSYDAAYGMLDKAQQAKQKQADFRRDAEWRDEIDGTVGACHIAAIGANDNTTASMTLSVTRSKSGEHQGALAVVPEGTGWKIHSVADEALGTDIGPIRTATRFCDDLASRNFADMATLFAVVVRASDLASEFYSTAYDLKMMNCTVDTSTYQLSASTASLVLTFTLARISTGATAGSVPLKVIFTKVGHDWKISDTKPVNS